MKVSIIQNLKVWNKDLKIMSGTSDMYQPSQKQSHAKSSSLLRTTEELRLPIASSFPQTIRSNKNYGLILENPPHKKLMKKLSFKIIFSESTPKPPPFNLVKSKTFNLYTHQYQFKMVEHQPIQKIRFINSKLSFRFKMERAWFLI